MKFSESWLRTWVDPAITTDELVAQLTMAGLEVDAVMPAAGAFSGVVVGEIIAVEPHPDAEQLRVCTVAGDVETRQVVCGAANARAGIKVPFATLGARLPGDLVISQAKLRGVDSFGMLCAQTELGLGDDDEGLWELPSDASVGTQLREYLALDSFIIDVDLTPNRGDCLSILGMAREVGVLNRLDLTELPAVATPVTIDDTLDVTVSAPAQCPVYATRVIKGIDASAPSPLWLSERLRRGGVRSINLVVDVTNYVMLELGQPMHAFDLDRLEGAIEVRTARNAESISLLDGQTLKLRPETLLITDTRGPLAVAGVMGGDSSAVTTQTTNVFLESAFFSPQAMAGAARSYGLHTESSHRFERGVDFDIQVRALERATQLLLDIAGGSAGPVQLHNHLAEHSALTDRRVRLRRKRLASGLGISLPDDQVQDILSRLGLVCLGEEAGAWVFSVPSHRFDIAIEEDLLEEVARIYGYDRLPVRVPDFSLNLPVQSETAPGVTDLRAHLVSRGFQEVITYSFVDPALQSHFSAGVVPLALRNPISSEMAQMRVSLLPGLLNVLKTNLNRQKSRVRCFETGLRFRSSDGTTANLNQEMSLACLIYGPRDEPGWTFAKATDADFYDLKGEMESLIRTLTTDNIVCEAIDDLPYLHPGQSAEIVVHGRKLGVIGCLHPSVQNALDLPKPVWVAELNLNLLLQRPLPAFKPISRFPEVSRDIAVIVPRDVSFQRVKNLAFTAAGNCLTNLKLFDVYHGEHIDPERKSLAFSLTFQHPSRTLRDEEINASVASVVSCLEKELNATLR